MKIIIKKCTKLLKRIHEQFYGNNNNKGEQNKVVVIKDNDLFKASLPKKTK